MSKQNSLSIITCHFNPDYDAVASMVAARRLYPEALLVFPGGSDKNLRHLFVESLIQSLRPARVGEIDPARVGRLIVVDTRQPGRIGELKEILANPGLDIHIYDHHPAAPGDLKGSVEVIAPVGATVTLLTELIAQRGLRLSAEEATMMAVGLYEDTGSFTFNSTTARDYQAGAFLLERGADLAVVSQLTVRELNTEQLALLNELIAAAETRQAKGYELVIACAQTEYYVEDVALLAHKMMEIMGLSILFLLVAMDNRVQLVIRSRLGTVDAAAIARAFGGGGHPSAAAASIKGMDLAQAYTKLNEVLQQSLGQFYNARSMMVSPPITIGDWEFLSRARELLVHFSINVLLVVDKSGQLKGFVSEHTVSNAQHHGLLDYSVKFIMNFECDSVSPEAGFNEICKIIVNKKQRVLPVVEHGKPVGVITRTDLLQALASKNKEVNVPPSRRDPGRRNLAALMREKWPTALLNLLDQMGLLADRVGVKLYAVGGCVRDAIMRLPCHDVDVTIDGDMEAFIKRLGKKHKLVRVVHHPRFKTATVETAGGLSVDISTTRREYYERPAALPVVEEGPLHMDLHRRDFTINSLAVSLNSSTFGELKDFYRGYQDIKDGYIRVLHNLSFVEDPTRTFRAVRFETRLGFKMSKMTLNLLEGAVRNNFLARLDRRRLLHELQLILSEDDPAPAIKRLAELGLLAYVHPKILLRPQQQEFFTRVRKVRDWLTLTFPEKVPQAWLLYLMALTDRLAPADLAELAASLGLKKKEAQPLAERQAADEIVARFKKSPKPLRPSQAYELFSGLNWVTTLFIMAKTENEDISQAGVAYLTTYRTVRPALNGRDLIELGLPHGPKLRQALNDLRHAKLDGLTQNKRDEVKYICERLAHYAPPAESPPKIPG